ncbi:MAG: S8 family serine peptidase [Ignavibacteriae bacterium]|nr:S8 family serine peptidase [Ignavibacteriota bacterium]
MKKICFFVILAFIVLISKELNSIGNSSPFEQIINKQSYAIYLKHKDIITTYIHTADLPDWAQLNPDKDGYEGTSTIALYEYLNTLNPVPQPEALIVAIMDTGFDIDHPELKNKIWENEKEINGKLGVDDDGNGFIDDFNGWNFLGKAVNLNLEATRELQRLKREGVSEKDSYYLKAKEEYDKRKQETKEIYLFASETLADWLKAENKLKEKDYPTEPEKLKEISTSLKGEYKEAANKILFIKMLYGISKDELIELDKDYSTKNQCLFDTTSVCALIGDNPELLSEKNYGDNDVYTKGASHGTHVSGIVAADKKGIGQSPFVKLMWLRVVPDEGDERDKDVANGIRYAVDNGASIINLSAGKYFSPNSNYVIDAIKYAEEKGVLFVVASGNEGTDIAVKRNFPPKYYIENGEMKYFSNMIVVGANTWMKKWSEEKDPDNITDGYDLAASFSNFSEKVVDLFAPGMEINSSVPGGKYERMSGTSMAAPEVTGVAAIIKGFYPNLNAQEIKIILTSSVRKYEGLKVKMREDKSKVLFSSLSKTGGVVDVFNAYKMAKEKYEK